MQDRSLGQMAAEISGREIHACKLSRVPLRVLLDMPQTTNNNFES